MTGSGDFDFLKGSWEVTNHRLRERLAGCDEWETFELRYDYLPLLGGQANVDRIYGSRNGQYFEGMSVRCFDPACGEWVIFWADIFRPMLLENVRGVFVDGVGSFFGTEILDGRQYRLRFLWQSLSDDSARWEQAYFDPDSESWETNWIMEFKRSSQTANW